MKKTLSIILSVCMLLSMATTAFAAYGEHEHKLMKMANMNSHYEECQVCFELFNVGEHTFKDGKCTVCGHDELVNPFDDVAKDAWYHDEIVKAVDTGIINGKSETKFAPDDLLTYAEALKLAACMNQVYLNGEVTLTTGEPWYKPYVDYCKANKIAVKEYNMDDNATRAGYMEIFAKALPDEAFTEINKIPDGSILDVKNSATYAHYVYRLYRAGIVTGVDEKHNCKPNDNILRSEVAAIISRMMNKDERVEFSMTESMGTLENEGTIKDNEDEEILNKTEKNENEPVVKEEPEEEPKEEPTDEPAEEPADEPTEEPTDEPTDEPADEPNDAPITEDVEIKTEYDAVVVNPEDSGKFEYEVDNNNYILSPLEIYKQPEGAELDEYGTEYALEVQVIGGKAPYTYEWYYKVRRDNVTIGNGDYVKDAGTGALVLSVEKENTLLGTNIYCKITDSEGETVTSDGVIVYGPFSMPVDESLNDSGNNILTGRVADGVVRKGDKLSVIRYGKVIAIGTADDLQMFNKSLDESVKGDNIGLVFKREDGVRPSSGDIVVKYQPSHVIDTSDIIN